MRRGLRKLLGVLLVAPVLVAGALSGPTSRGDEPSRLGRLFRLGNNNPPSPTQAPSTIPSLNSSSAVPSLLPPPTTATTPAPPATSAGPRILPQPRHSRPITEADPILTRAAVNRTSDGTLFCDFLMVYADGTVLDGGGVHNVSREVMRPLVEAIHSGDAFRIRGHCGGPPTDYIEQVHVVVYERNLGRLRSHAFSYSGNTDGCDATIKHLQAAMEAIQTKISAPANMPPGSAGPATSPAASAVPTISGAPSTSTGRTIPLTPLN